MKLFRFMSDEEYNKLTNNEVLFNNTKHTARTNSIGFCFMDYEQYKPEDAVHFLSGIVSLDKCVIFETNKELNKTYGEYAKPIEFTGNNGIDMINLFRRWEDTFTADEYCTTEYSLKDFKILKIGTINFDDYYNECINWRRKNNDL